MTLIVRDDSHRQLQSFQSTRLPLSSNQTLGMPPFIPFSLPRLQHTYYGFLAVHPHCPSPSRGSCSYWYNHPAVQFGLHENGVLGYLHLHSCSRILAVQLASEGRTAYLPRAKAARSHDGTSVPLYRCPWLFYPRTDVNPNEFVIASPDSGTKAPSPNVNFYGWQR